MHDISNYYGLLWISWKTVITYTFREENFARMYHLLGFFKNLTQIAKCSCLRAGVMM